MTERDNLAEIWDNVKRDAVREEAKKFEQACDEIAGNVRRMWREGGQCGRGVGWGTAGTARQVQRRTLCGGGR